jgi:hypothetical protein
MASLVSKVTQFARSPQGRRLTERAQEYARRPETRRQIAQVRARFARGRPGTR